MSKGKFALGAMFGAAVGAVVGFLTAPQSGKKTRADLTKKGEALKKEFDECTDEVIADTTKAVKEAKNKADVIAEDAKKQASEAFEKTKDTVEDFRDRSERAAKAAKEAFNEKK